MKDSSPVKIVPFTGKDAPLWDDYVNTHPGGTLFHLAAWKRIVEKTFGHNSFYFIAKNRDGIQGVLPVFEMKSLLFGHFFVSVAFAETGGMLAGSREAASQLLDQISGISRAKGAAYVELRNTRAHPGLATKDLYYNFSKELFPDHEMNLKAIPRKSRAMVRKAIKKGLVSERGHHLVPEFYALLAGNFHRLGTPVFPRRLIENMLAEFGDKAGILVVRTPGGDPVAGVLYLMYKDRMVPYYAGSDFSSRHLAPNDFMYWELMQLAVDTGLTVFDFGRSKIGTGSFSFKKHWGFKPVPLAYQYVLGPGQEMPNLSPANPKYQRKIELWRKMPPAFTRFIGPFLSKYLG
ncbi:MAG: FemAB family PEP-CTERM system-associated protein [Desulfobacterales bacterium]|nr:FemAB family PEP-CTERM system-associated protein [Desulfobacterales bacterium]